MIRNVKRERSRLHVGADHPIIFLRANLDAFLSVCRRGRVPIMREPPLWAYLDQSPNWTAVFTNDVTISTVDLPLTPSLSHHHDHHSFDGSLLRDGHLNLGSGRTRGSGHKVGRTDGEFRAPLRPFPIDLKFLHSAASPSTLLCSSPPYYAALSGA